MYKKVRICFILSHFGQGGAERQTLNLIKGLNPSFYEITLLIYEERLVFYEEIFDLPINLVFNEIKCRNKILKMFKIVSFLRNFFKKNNFDLLHTLLFHNGFWVRLLAPRKYNQRIIYSIRNNLNDAKNIIILFEKFFIKKSIVVTNSKQSQQQLVNIIPLKYKERVKTIYNGIDFEKFASEITVPVNSKIIIGTVGRQTTQKNQIQILKVISQIKEIYPIYFYLIGNVQQDKAIEIETFVHENSLERYVTIMNSHPSIEMYYKKFNIFILSSLYEGCPNVLFEAMLSRCLCIVSDGANSDNFIVDGFNGFVYDGTTEMLLSKLKDAIELLNSHKAEIIINNGFHYVYDHFSTKVMVGNYEELYNYIISNCE